MAKQSAQDRKILFLMDSHRKMTAEIALVTEQVRRLTLLMGQMPVGIVAGKRIQAD